MNGYEESKLRHLDSTLGYVECACWIAIRGLRDATVSADSHRCSTTNKSADGDGDSVSLV